MNKNKKIKVFIIIFSLSLLMVLFWGLLLVITALLKVNESNRNIVMKFEPYRDSCDYLVSIIKEDKSKNYSYILITEGQKYELYAVDKIYGNRIYMDLDDKIIEDVRYGVKISTGRPMTRIYCLEDCIVFDTDDGDIYYGEALVYSFSGKKPSYFYEHNGEGCDYRKYGDGWYSYWSNL